MRGLNLARLALSSEAKFVTEKETEAAVSRLRGGKSEAGSRPRPSQALHPSPGESASVDVVSFIAGHSAYSKIVAGGACEALAARRAAQQPRVPLAQQLGSPKQAGLQSLPTAADPKVMRVLSANRLGVYYDLQAKARARAAENGREPLPVAGQEARVVGAVVGLQAFGVATAVVGSVGVAMIGYLYFSPTAVDGLRQRSIAFRKRLEDGPVGRGMRGITVDAGGNSKEVFTAETRARLRGVARRATGMKSSDVVEDAADDVGAVIGDQDGRWDWAMTAAGRPPVPSAHCMFYIV